MIVLDTHTWVWWVAESKALSTRARRAIEAADEITISVISCWELAMLVEKERLGLSEPVERWIERAIEFPRFRVLPLTPTGAVKAARLADSFHGDPADRMIAATCLEVGAALVTKDRALRAWRGLQTIW